jgi:antitoxin component YwqK of YwqJK toxin-antitoxin module
MAQKAHSLFKSFFLLIIAIYTTGCNKKTKDEGVVPLSLVVSTIGIPKDTILVTDSNLTLRNGIYYFNKRAYSGYIKEMYNPEQAKCLFSFLNGQQQDLSLVYFQNGELKESRSYQLGKSFGRHYGYWENGNPKFDFIYVNDRREGLQKQWYESGGKYSFLNFKNDREDGMQNAWRENGKPYINYEARDGRRYGLQKSNLCYTLKDQKLKIASK